MSNSDVNVWEERYRYLETQFHGLFIRLQRELETNIDVIDFSVKRTDGRLKMICVAQGYDLRYRFAVESGGVEVASTVFGRQNNTHLNIAGYEKRTLRAFVQVKRVEGSRVVSAHKDV